MAWIIKSIVKIMLSILDDVMAWGASLINNLELDIGNSDPKGKSSTAFDWSFIDPSTAGNGGVLAKTFPAASSYCYYFVVLAMIIVLIIVLFKLWQGFISPFTDAEPPVGVVLRGCLASFGVMASYTIFVSLERLFNIVFSKFKSKFDTDTEGALSRFVSTSKLKEEVKKTVVHGHGGSGVAGEPSIAKQSTNKIKSYSDDSIKPWSSGKLINTDNSNNITANGSGISLMIIECVIGFALFFSFIKLVMEVYERYCVLGLLFYTCPLAFALLASKSTKNITSNWFQMVISQFVLMCMNLFFVGTFIGAINTRFQVQKSGYIFDTDVEFVRTMMLLLGWTIIGQKADEYMKGLGLSVANTGQGLGAALAAGITSTYKMAQTGYRTAKGAAKGGAKIGSAIYGKKHPSAASPKLSKAERKKSAENNLNKADIGSMTPAELQQNMADRNAFESLGRDVNTNKIDWEKSAADSGQGMQVLKDSEGNVLDMSIAPNSPAATKLQEDGVMMAQAPGNGYLTPISKNDLERFESATKNAAINGHLVLPNGETDPTKYKVMGATKNGGNIELQDPKTGTRRTINFKDYHNIKGNTYVNKQEAIDIVKAPTN